MAEPMFSSYDPGAVSVVFGALILTGFAQESMVSVERMTDTWSDQAGSQGQVTRARSRDKRGTITLSLDMSSPSNDDLTKLYNADELTQQGALPILMRDASGSTLASGDAAWIVKPATIEYGPGILARQWSFRVAHLTMNIGGNS